MVNLKKIVLCVCLILISSLSYAFEFCKPFVGELSKLNVDIGFSPWSIFLLDEIKKPKNSNVYFEFGKRTYLIVFDKDGYMSKIISNVGYYQGYDFKYTDSHKFDTVIENKSLSKIQVEQVLKKFSNYGSVIFDDFPIANNYYTQYQLKYNNGNMCSCNRLDKPQGISRTTTYTFIQSKDKQLIIKKNPKLSEIVGIVINKLGKNGIEETIGISGTDIESSYCYQYDYKNQKIVNIKKYFLEIKEKIEHIEINNPVYTIIKKKKYQEIIFEYDSKGNIIKIINYDYIDEPETIVQAIFSSNELDKFITPDGQTTKVNVSKLGNSK